MNNPPNQKITPPKPRPRRAIPKKIPTILQVIVTCQNETEQREVYEQLKTQNKKCRLVML